MAQVHRPLSLPTSNFLGRPEQRAGGAAPSLPPIRTDRPHPGAPRYDGPQLPPLHLPPIASEPPRLPSHSSTRLGITDLLSTQPPSPAPLRPTASTLLTYQHGDALPPSSAPAGSRHEQGPQYLAHPSNRSPPPNQSRQTQPPLPAERFTLSHPSQHHSVPSSEPEPQYSPAVTARSSVPSLYDSMSDASPRTSILTAETFRRPQETQSPPFIYTLSIRQQPAAARACGFGERDRRVIDPPPILELRVTDKTTGAPTQDYIGMLALHCTLLSPDGRDDETEVPPAHPNMPSTRRLMGTLVASPYQAKDEHGVAGTFFVFPDLSCRSPGRYRLRFKLLRVDPTNMQPGAVHGSVAYIVTDVFSVFTAKDFPGMRASSALLKSLRRQGLNVGVKKGSEARKGKGTGKKGNESSGDDDDDGDDSASEEERQEEQRRDSGGSGSTEARGATRSNVKRRPKRKRRDS